MNRRDEPDVAGLESDLPTGGQRLVGDLDAYRSRLQLSQTGHLGAVQVSGIPEIALLERRRLPS
jgi:hypothetical protein